MAMEGEGVKQCCAAFYESDFVRLLLGDSFHPGGTKLTGHVGTLLGLRPGASVLDIASGPGTSAFHLAESFGCKVTGVDLSEENVRLAAAEAQRRGLAEHISFQLGDAERLPFGDDTFEAIICECAFCTFPYKSIAAEEIYRVLKSGGQLGLSDLTRSEQTIPGLEGLLSWIACIGDALPVERYSDILQQAGLQVLVVEDQSDALLEMVRQIQAKLLGAEIMTGLKKIDLPGVDFATAKQFAQAALEAIRGGALGYAVIAARKQ
jgi:arsenite methyltransferase